MQFAWRSGVARHFATMDELKLIVLEHKYTSKPDDKFAFDARAAAKKLDFIVFDRFSTA